MDKQLEWLTVKAAAEKAGLTTQAIYKKIKANELQTQKEKGLTYVLWEEVANSSQPVDNTDATSVGELLKCQMETNQQTINLLQTQLQEKDEQIKHLHLIMAQSQENLKTTQLALTSAEAESQASWWGRLFSREKGKTMNEETSH